MWVRDRQRDSDDSRRMVVETSLLDRMIERLVTQRACLERAVKLIASLPGPVIELGLGKARTYDHLRRLVPNRRILVFDREIHAPEAYVPDGQDLYLGDFRDTLREVQERLRGTVVLLHADIGSTDRDRDRRLIAELIPLIEALVCDSGIVVSDREMPQPHWESLALPSSAGDWRYYMYRVRKAGK